VRREAAGVIEGSFVRTPDTVVGRTFDGIQYFPLNDFGRIQGRCGSPTRDDAAPQNDLQLTNSASVGGLDIPGHAKRRLWRLKNATIWRAVLLYGCDQPAGARGGALRGERIEQSRNLALYGVLLL